MIRILPSPLPVHLLSTQFSSDWYMVITHERGLFANPPNILIVYGDELLKGNYRENLRDYLYKSPSAPIGKGTHDFWITYGSGGSPNHSWEDMSITPRPMRGIVEMGAIPIALDPPSIRMHLSVLTQEISHQWLVPTDLSIKHEDFWPSTSSRPYKIPYADETALSLQEGTPLYGPPLLGREDIHWSAFFQSDQSVQDGVSWTDIGEEGGHRIWRQKYIAQPVAQPAGL